MKESLNEEFFFFCGTIITYSQTKQIPGYITAHHLTNKRTENIVLLTINIALLHCEITIFQL